MVTEIELKLLVSGDVITQIEQVLLPTLGVATQAKEFSLYNQYFDSAEQVLRKHHIGLRIRNKKGKFEQTLKTSGKTVAGLHQRPEFNVELENDRLKLELFDPKIWPQDIDVGELQKSILAVFKTDFTRREYNLKFEDGTHIEMVYDTGHIKTDNQQLDINEIELELKHGNPSVLFDIAAVLSDKLEVQLGNLSKAARGYMLANGRSLQAKPRDAYLKVDAEDSCETAFIKAVEYSLNYWQHHEQCYLQNVKIKQLEGMIEGMRLLLQTLTLYLPNLQCPSLLELHKALMAQVNKWYWLEQSISLKELRSPRGPYRKLAKNEELMSYLRGLSERLIKRFNPKHLINSRENLMMQLNLSRLLIDKPWRDTSTSYDTTVSEHANGWLSQGWHNVQQSMPVQSNISARDYIFQQTMLRQTLYNGFLLGNLFDEVKEYYRAPWLDLLNGIDELKTLVFLQQKLRESDLNDKTEGLQWTEEKITSLLSVMERSRGMAVRAEAYW